MRVMGGTMVGLAALLLGGCAAVPPAPEAQGIKVNQIVDALQCELKSAYLESARLGKQGKNPLADMAFSAELELIVVNENGISAGGSLIVPITDGTVTPSIGLTASGRSTRTAKVKFSGAFGKFKTDSRHCPPQTETGLPEAQLGFGAGTWVRDAFLAVDSGDRVSVADLAYVLEFRLIRGVNGGVAVATSTFRGGADQAGTGMTNTATNTLTLGVTHLPSNDPVQVEIVKKPKDDKTGDSNFFHAAPARSCRSQRRRSGAGRSTRKRNRGLIASSRAHDRRASASCNSDSRQHLHGVVPAGTVRPATRSHAMLSLYYAPKTCALAVHIALEEAGLPYEAVKLDFSKQEQQSQAYLTVNPKGRVPALATEAGILTETVALLAYIAQIAPQARLAPSDPFAFAQAQAFNAYLASTVHVAHAHRPRASRWADDEAAQAAMRAKVPANMAGCFELIETSMLRGPWVLGDAYSICDPYLYTIASWLKSDAVEIADFPNVAAHTQRMNARPAVAKVMALHA